MNSVMRWLCFNGVGAMGMAVQLSSLALLSRVMPGHYLASSAIAVEVAILQNFLWHRRFTWRDRHGLEFRECLVRFQTANGLVSLIGNLMLMRLLVGVWRWPLVVGNAAAVAVCSLVNFWAGDRWVFRDMKQVFQGSYSGKVVQPQLIGCRYEEVVDSGPGFCGSGDCPRSGQLRDPGVWG